MVELRHRQIVHTLVLLHRVLALPARLVNSRLQVQQVHLVAHLQLLSKLDVVQLQLLFYLRLFEVGRYVVQDDFILKKLIVIRLGNVVRVNLTLVVLCKSQVLLI
jgi:hypothetical protein